MECLRAEHVVLNSGFPPQGLFPVLFGPPENFESLGDESSPPRTFVGNIVFNTSKLFEIVGPSGRPSLRINTIHPCLQGFQFYQSPKD